MDLIRSIQQGRLVESRHRRLKLNMTNSETQSEVQSKEKSRNVRIVHHVYGFSLIPKEL